MSDRSKIEREILESQIIATMLEGRGYPNSHSDMGGCVRNLLKMFDVKRRPLVETGATGGEAGNGGDRANQV